MMVKLKKRKNGKAIKKEFVKRTKKAFKLTPKEKFKINRLKNRIKRSVTKKKIKDLGSRVDFNRLRY